MNYTWTSEILIFSAIVTAILMTIVIFTFCVFRKDKFMMTVMCSMIFIYFFYLPVMEIEKQKRERARAQALQKPQTVNIWLEPVLVMTSDAPEEHSFSSSK
ncbi:hypothetical protein [Cardiobacterium hominis]|uniref:hypothetical protein n=1 Tax=Cardiobacterium hominis TaxID=2718 RepID=UPI0028EDBA95|nr:hypothetical protein [Cardiobacterium hominis]